MKQDERLSMLSLAESQSFLCHEGDSLLTWLDHNGNFVLYCFICSSCAFAVIIFIPFKPQHPYNLLLF